MLVGTIVLAALLTSHPLLDTAGTALIDTVVIVAAIALFLGLLNVLRVHLQIIRRQPSDRLYSLVLIAAMLVVLVAGLPILPNQPSGPSQPLVQWIFEYIQAPIQASLSGLLVFFVMTAAYRLLRARNVESALMLITALLVLAGQTAVGLVPVLPEIRDWILDVPAMAGVRGILLGVALGALLTGIRLLLGVERPYSD
jgi:hypothetical protein